MGARAGVSQRRGVKLLLDTHALIWWLRDDERLTPHVADLVAAPENAVFVSAATAWECAIKVRSGKLPEAAHLVDHFATEMDYEGFALLDIRLEHALAAGALVRHHGDPFDRMPIAQAMVEGMTLVSNETAFDRYSVARTW